MFDEQIPRTKKPLAIRIGKQVVTISVGPIRNRHPGIRRRDQIANPDEWKDDADQQAADPMRPTTYDRRFFLFMICHAGRLSRMDHRFVASSLNHDRDC